MPLINCPECNKEISDKAPACPNCGCPKEEFYAIQQLQSISPSSTHCRECDETIPVDTETCPHCGLSLFFDYEPYELDCPQCDKKISCEVKKCPYCGYSDLCYDLRDMPEERLEIVKGRYEFKQLPPDEQEVLQRQSDKNLEEAEKASKLAALSNAPSVTLPK